MTAPTPPPAPEPPPSAGLAAVAAIAERRGLGWTTFAAVFDAPSAGWVHALAAGQLVRDLEAATDWRSGERGDFAPALIRLGAYGRAAWRRGEEVEAGRLEAAHAALAAAAGQQLAAAHEACGRLAAWCAEESAAWAARQPARARELRIQQDSALAGAEGTAVRQAAAALTGHATGAPYAALAELCLAWLDREATGAGLSGVASSASRSAEPRG